MDKFTVDQFLKSSECESLRNTTKQILLEYDYLSGIRFIKAQLISGSLCHVNQCFHTLLDEVLSQ